MHWKWRTLLIIAGTVVVVLLLALGSILYSLWDVDRWHTVYSERSPNGRYIASVEIKNAINSDGNYSRLTVRDRHNRMIDVSETDEFMQVESVVETLHWAPDSEKVAVAELTRLSHGDIPGEQAVISIRICDVETGHITKGYWSAPESSDIGKVDFDWKWRDQGSLVVYAHPSPPGTNELYPGDENPNENHITQQEREKREGKTLDVAIARMKDNADEQTIIFKPIKKVYSFIIP